MISMGKVKVGNEYLLRLYPGDPGARVVVTYKSHKYQFINIQRCDATGFDGFGQLTYVRARQMITEV